MDLRDQAAVVAFNRALACVVAEYRDSLIVQGFDRSEAVAMAAAWTATYMRLCHEQAHPRPDQA